MHIPIFQPYRWPDLVTTHSQSIDFTPKKVAIKTKLPTDPKGAELTRFNHAAESSWGDAKLCGRLG